MIRTLGHGVIVAAAASLVYIVYRVYTRPRYIGQTRVYGNAVLTGETVDDDATVLDRWFGYDREYKRGLLNALVGVVGLAVGIGALYAIGSIAGRIL